MADVAQQYDGPPTVAIWGAGVIMALAFGAALIGRWGDVGTVRVPEAPAVASRMLTIINAPDYSATVRDASDGRIVHVAKPGQEDGFIWGAVNGLSYGRKLRGAPADAPFELIRRADGRLMLRDAATDEKIALDAFGSGNAAAFGRLLDK